MWNRLSLRGRIYSILAALVLITMTGALTTVWYTFQMEEVLTSIVESNLTAYETAEALETALVNQKGFVSYYFLDGNPEWLRKLDEYRRIFRNQLEKARRLVADGPRQAALARIKSEYRLYIDVKDRVIEQYQAGNRNVVSGIHQEARKRFFKILALCEDYKAYHRDIMARARTTAIARAHRFRLMAAGAILIEFLLGMLLVFILIRHVLGPVRRLSMISSTEGGRQKPDNEIQALDHRIHRLVEDIHLTHSELEKSREHLLQSEKMALVGKLAAGMAHSIRNPFTSVKMRLFSLERTLNLSDPQKDDLEVISEEIRHIDTIVQNFLEFSRPPKLKMQRISPSIVVDSAIQLLSHRLKSYDVRIKVLRDQPLPEIQADPEQLKEVLVNLVVNACEAMGYGGSIAISEAVTPIQASETAVVIRIRDSGPGISESIRDNIFQPFFTTKEEGTGLGLSIAARIIDEHQGRLEASSAEGQGAVFTIKLPVTEKHVELHSDH